MGGRVADHVYFEDFDVDLGVEKSVGRAFTSHYTESRAGFWSLFFATR